MRRTVSGSAVRNRIGPTKSFEQQGGATTAGPNNMARQSADKDTPKKEAMALDNSLRTMGNGHEKDGDK